VLGAMASLVVTFRVDDKLSRLAAQGANILGWIGVLGGAVGIYYGDMSGFESLLGIAGCAMLAVLPANLPSTVTRRFGVPFVGAIAVSLGLGALIGGQTGPDPTMAPGQSELLLLYAGVSGTLAAAVSSLVSSTSLADLSLGPDGRPSPSVGAALLIVLACVGVWFLGSARSVDGIMSWAVPLAAGGESLVWRIPDGANLPRGLSLQAAQSLSYAVPLLVVSIVAACVAAWLAVAEKSETWVAAAWAVPGVCAGAFAGVVAFGLLEVSAPDASRYADIATNWVLERGLPEQLVELGGYATDGAATVDLASLLPEFILLGTVVALSLVCVVLTLAGTRSVPEDDSDALAVGMFSRDLTIRAMIIGWLAWITTVLVHWAHFGYYGVGSPSEVVFVGSLTLASGIGLLGWSLPRRAPWGRVRALTSALMLAVLVLAFVLSLVFNTPVGLSLSL
jgi:hypothetical protein